MGDLPEQYHKIVSEIITGMRKIMADGEQVYSIMFLGKFGFPLFPLPMNTENNTSKDQSAIVASAFAKAIEAEYAIMISEGYTLPAKMPMEEQFAMLKKYGSVEECPCREEIVFMTLETLNGVYLAQQPILNLESEARGFKDFEFKLTDAIEGRFTNFLSPSSKTMH